MPSSLSDIVCLSHLRWDFVYQRPNHLMARAARSRRVFFVEEPQSTGIAARIEVANRDGVTIVRPLVPANVSQPKAIQLLREAIEALVARERIERPWLWYYTPMALPWSAGISAGAVVYDCMDDLASFKFAPPALHDLEQRLMRRADVVFTGGRSLYEAKRDRHKNVFMFPSSVDRAHFAQARGVLADPPDQAAIGRPRIGYFGVIDERIDLSLVADIASQRPGWNIVMVGPLAKIAEADLPQAANLHWLGMKTYADLPAYLAGWDVAMMPFALNDATRHISPTKTPEYLSGGRPVVSTPIRDVVHPYGDERLVHIASNAAAFVEAIEAALACDRDDLIARADRFLASQSWDATWSTMERLVEELAPRPRVAMPVLVGPSAPAARRVSSRAMAATLGGSAGGAMSSGVPGIAVRE